MAKVEIECKGKIKMRTGVGIPLAHSTSTSAAVKSSYVGTEFSSSDTATYVEELRTIVRRYTFFLRWYALYFHFHTRYHCYALLPNQHPYYDLRDGI
jgi:hypothetical protein